jgi:hypothetical protein
MKTVSCPWFHRYERYVVVQMELVLQFKILYIHRVWIWMSINVDAYYEYLMNIFEMTCGSQSTGPTTITEVHLTQNFSFHQFSSV